MILLVWTSSLFGLPTAPIQAILKPQLPHYPKYLLLQKKTHLAEILKVFSSPFPGISCSSHDFVPMMTNSAIPISPVSQRDSGAVPRKLYTGAKPTRMLYVEPIRKMVVAMAEVKEEREPPAGYRVLHSTLNLLKVDDDSPLEEANVKLEDENVLSNRLLVAQYELKHAERVYSITQWPFVDHQGNKYSLLIVGTGVQAGLDGEIGRRLIFNTGKNGTKLRLQKESTYEHPVYCIVMWNNDSTVSVIGKALSLDWFDSQAGR